MTDELLRLLGVSRCYEGPPPVRALTDVDLTVHRGELFAVTGFSGSGKTTLLNILGLLDEPTEGTYRIRGRPAPALRTRTADEFRGRTFGFVFQSAHLLPDRTVAVNVALPLRIGRYDVAGRGRRVAEALDQVGLLHRARVKAVDLSGGERQRAAAARALVARPEVLLADEPTGNLDSENARRIMEILGDLNDQGLTVGVITHDESVATLAPWRITVADGRLRG